MVTGNQIYVSEEDSSIIVQITLLSYKQGILILSAYLVILFVIEMVSILTYDNALCVFRFTFMSKVVEMGIRVVEEVIYIQGDHYCDQQRIHRFLKSLLQ